MGQSAAKKLKPTRDSIDDIAQYYSSNSEEQRLQIQQLEYHITSRLLLKYLDTPGHVLEVGAGPGHYTAQLASCGHTVTAVELVQALTEQSQQRIKHLKLEDKVTWHTGDARDLVNHVQGSIDYALVMGPLYHLVSMRERVKLMEAIGQRVRRKGLVVTTHLTRVGLLGYMMARFPAWAFGSPGQVEEVIETGFLSEHPRNGEFRGYFSTLEEIRDLHEGLGFDVIQMHSQDPCIGSIDEVFNNMPLELQNAWADALARISHDTAALGSGRSIMCVSRV